MAGAGAGQAADGLLRQLDRGLAGLRSELSEPDWVIVELIADALRQLVIDTMQASAADRARVRAAVHYFLLRGLGRDARRDQQPSQRRTGPGAWRRPVRVDLLVVNQIVRDLGRPDLVVHAGPEGWPEPVVQAGLADGRLDLVVQAGSPDGRSDLVGAAPSTGEPAAPAGAR